MGSRGGSLAGALTGGEGQDGGGTGVARVPEVPRRCVATTERLRPRWRANYLQSVGVLEPRLRVQLRIDNGELSYGRTIGTSRK